MWQCRPRLGLGASKSPIDAIWSTLTKAVADPDLGKAVAPSVGDGFGAASEKWQLCLVVAARCLVSAEYVFVPDVVAVNPRRV